LNSAAQNGPNSVEKSKTEFNFYFFVDQYYLSPITYMYRISEH